MHNDIIMLQCANNAVKFYTFSSEIVIKYILYYTAPFVFDLTPTRERHLAGAPIRGRVSNAKDRQLFHHVLYTPLLNECLSDSLSNFILPHAMLSSEIPNIVRRLKNIEFDQQASEADIGCISILE